jgi:Pyridoxamine 5'-phosphate oxidase
MGERILTDDVLAFLQRRVMVSVASRNANHVPSAVRCVGFRVHEASQRITVFVVARQAERVLADIRATGLVAVVFSEPHTHRTVQLKGARAIVGPLEEGDWPTIGAYSDLAVAELGPLGYAEVWIRKLFECTPAQALAVRFVPSSAFAQTPGPRAGARLSGTQP